MAVNYTDYRTAYTAHNWQPGDAITKERIMAIENQLALLSTQNQVDMENAIDLDSRIGTKNNDDPAGSVIQLLRTIRLAASTASTNAGDALNSAKRGQWAWGQIKDATENTLSGNADPVFTKTLNQRFQAIEREFLNLSGTLRNQVNLLETAVSGAKTRTYLDGHLETADSLVKRLNNTDLQAERILAAVDTLLTNYETAAAGEGSLHGRLVKDEQDIDNLKTQMNRALKSYHNHSARTEGTEVSYTYLDDRLEADEGRINAVQDEIIEAHESSPFSKTGNNAYTNINKRFEAIESDIKGARGDKSSLINNLLSYSNIENNLSFNGDSNTKVLDAKLGKVLKETIDTLRSDTNSRLEYIDGNTTPTKNLPTVISMIGTGVGTNTDTGNENTKTIGLQLANLRGVDSSILSNINTIEDKIGNGVGTNTTTGNENTKTIGLQLANLRTADSSIINKIGNGVGTNTTTGAENTKTIGLQLANLRDADTSILSDINTKNSAIEAKIGTGVGTNTTTGAENTKTVGQLLANLRNKDTAIDNVLGQGVGNETTNSANINETDKTVSLQLSNLRNRLGDNVGTSTSASAADTDKTASLLLSDLRNRLGSGVGATNNVTTGTATAQLGNLRSRLGNGIGTITTNDDNNVAETSKTASLLLSNLRRDVSTIATELGMYNSGAIQDNNTKVDALNANVLALGKEIGMLTEGTTLLPLAEEIDRSLTRIDTINSDLNTAKGNITAINAKIGTGFDSTPGNTVAEKIVAAQDAAATDATSKANAALENAIADTNLKLGYNPALDGSTGSTVASKIATAKAAAEATASQDATNKANAAQAAAEATASADATTKANAAQAAAEATASLDATAKANAAKAYADSKFGDDITTANTVSDQLQAINDKFGDTITSSNKVVDAIATAKSEAISAAESDATSKAGAAEAAAKSYADTKASAAETAAKDYADTGLALKANASDVTDALAGKADNNTVNVISTTIVKLKTEVEYDAEGNPSLQLLWTIDEKNDYLLQNTEDNKYYYWKYIATGNNNAPYKWEKISGGGGSGSGNSNAEDFLTRAAFIAARKELNKDYYVQEDDGIVHHYRYLGTTALDEPIEIGITPDLIKAYQIDLLNTTKTVIKNNQEVQEAVNYLDFYGFNFGTDVIQHQIDPSQDESYRLARFELPAGGGGGGVDTGIPRIYARLRGDLTQRISLNDATTNGITLSFGAACYSIEQEGDGPVNYIDEGLSYTLTRGDGQVIATSNGQPIDILTKANYDAGYSNIVVHDIEKKCITNETTSFTLLLHTPNNAEVRDKSITVYITIVDLSLESTFSDQLTYNVGTPGGIAIPYTFTGMAGQSPTFTVTITTGNETQTITPDVSETQLTIRTSTLLRLGSGVHNLQIKASLIISGSPLDSNILYYQLGLVDGTSNDELMLFGGLSLTTQRVEQYKILKLPYYLFVPDGGTATIHFDAKRAIYNDLNVLVDYEPVLSLNRADEVRPTGTYDFNFRIYEMAGNIGYYVITITANNTRTLVFNIIVNKAAEEIKITPNYLFDFRPEQFNNNTENIENRLWHYENGNTTYRMRIPEGAHFDWRTGGWMTVTEGDKTDIPCFCVRAGSRVEFVLEKNNQTSPLTLFWPGMETNGSNFKCTFKIDNVKTPDAPFLTSLDKNTNIVTKYGSTILSDTLDVEDDDTLLHSYINTKYIYTVTKNIIKGSEKDIKEAIGTTVLNNSPFNEELTMDSCVAAANKALKKNSDKIKQYISNMYKIANLAKNTTHKEYLLKVLSGKDTTDNTVEINYNTIEAEIIAYLFDETAYKNTIITYPSETIVQVASNCSNANATTVFQRLQTEEADSSTITYAYRQVEPVNLDALLNGFEVEGKSGKDGIIAMMKFYFTSTIRNGGSFIQRDEDVELISTNTFNDPPTGTFRVKVLVHAAENANEEDEYKFYEVEMNSKTSNNTTVYTEIKGIRDASNKVTKHYGLELNALGSNIYLPSGVVNYAHSEGDVIEFEYNVNPPLEQHINSSVIIYEDGVPSAAKLYVSGNDIFDQADPGCLTIGSDDCDVYIYKMRLYNRALENSEILDNFYADGLTTDDMSERYSRNKNLVNAVKNNTITPQLVAEECPDLRIIMIEAPTLTGGKTSFIKNTKIRCIYKNGRPEDNWVALNAYHAGQGTSSDNYGAAGRNLDIIFGFDGEDTVIIPKPQKNNYTFDPDYKSIVITGLDDDDTNDIKTAEEYENEGYTVVHNQPGQVGKVSLTPTSVPNNWFNIKVNIASSENTNNAFLQKRYDRYLKQIYKTPAQKRGDEEGIEIKNDMEFFNCVIFIKETGTASEFTEDNSKPVAERPWHFYGIGNIGDSKKTDSTRVNIPGDPNEFAIEITDNGLLLSGFSTGVFYISEASKERNKPFEGYKINEINTELASLNADLLVAQQNSDIQSINRINTRIAELQTYIPEATSLSATTAHICTSEEYTASNDSYTFNITTPDSATLYLVPVVSSITYYRRFMYISNRWTEINEPITFTRTSYGIKYPVSKAEWECNLNTYRNGLMDTDSGKGWDKSFEFRYDLTTKDGETVARNDTEAALNALRLKANKLMFAKLYTWIATSSNKEFKDNLGDWFIKESPLYWYLFTERYTMIDSRAKNTFYHCGKVYITEDEAAGANVDTLYAALLTAQQGDDLVAIENAQTAYNVAVFLRDNARCFLVDNTLANEAHNYGYRFDYWDYDDDTALGINNNGLMVFSAGLEDIDKDITGWIYNEAESVVWRRVRENMYSELGALYVRLKEQCFNAENLIQEFDTLQAQFPEELWRMDFERKYYRPFEKSNETIYLNDMANGRKKYQRRQFERNMAIYINSKYQRNGSYNPDDLISFRPLFDWTSGLDTELIIKPYSTMYINFALGNYDNTTDVVSNVQSALSVRVNRGEEYRIEVSDYIHLYRNIQCIIYNASRLMSIDGLGKFHCQLFSLATAKKLTTLILGHPTITNESLKDMEALGISAGLPLLETLDLQNIHFLDAIDTLPLANFPLLKTLNAKGSNIHSFTFKNGGMLEKIIFPSELTKIDFRDLYKLVDKIENGELVRAVQLNGASHLVSYNSENSYSNSYIIVLNMIDQANGGIENITQLTLNDINWTIGNINELEPLARLKNRIGDKMSLAGVINVTGSWSTVEKNNYLALWNNRITINTIPDNMVVRYRVRYFLSENDITNNVAPLYSAYLTPTNGNAVSLGTDPAYNGTIDRNLLKKDPTISTIYVFGEGTTYRQWTGWRKTTSGISIAASSRDIDNDTDLVAIFNEEARTYPIKWYLHENHENESPVYVSTPVAYGKSYDLLAPTIHDIKTGSNGVSTKLLSKIEYADNSRTMISYYEIFNGWSKSPINLTEVDEIEQAFIITGRWISGSNISVLSVKDDPSITPLKLLLYSTYTSTSSDNPLLELFPVASTMDVHMGYNGIATGTELIGSNTTTRTNDNQLYNAPVNFIYDNGYVLDPFSYPTIKPFSSGLSFTLMLDYRFDAAAMAAEFGESGYGILAGCFEKINNSTQGFALYYNAAAHSPGICFGDLTNDTSFTNNSTMRLIGDSNSSNYRNIVVLRYHPDNSGEKILDVYSGIVPTIETSIEGSFIINNFVLSLRSTAFNNDLHGSQSSSNAALCFGDFMLDHGELGSAGTFQALGTVYLAKYWNSDLGHDECIRLASWPHETITFAVEQHAATSTKILKNTDSQVITNIIFTALNSSSYGGLFIDKTSSTGDEAPYSWNSENSLFRKIANLRFFMGLPMYLQSLMKTTRISASGATWSEDTQSNNNHYMITSHSNSNDYIFLPTYQEVYTGSASITTYKEAEKAFDWNDGTYTKVRTGSSSNSAYSDVTSATRNAAFMNLRFPSVPLSLEANSNNIFVGTPSGTTAIYNKIFTPGNTLSGTVIYEDGSSAYIYANENQVAQGAPIIRHLEKFRCSVGGWVPATPWWLRTAFAPTKASSNNLNKYYQVDKLASANPIIGNYNAPIAGLVCSFGI